LAARSLKTAEHDGPLEIQANFLKEQADVDALVAGVELGSTSLRSRRSAI
jgi:hypothetical protein